MNPFQRACADAYGGGDFAHVRDLDEAREAGDTLFAFLMIELGSSEGCDSAEEAVRRLDMAIADIQGVAEAIHRGGSRADEGRGAEVAAICRLSSPRPSDVIRSDTSAVRRSEAD